MQGAAPVVGSGWCCRSLWCPLLAAAAKIGWAVLREESAEPNSIVRCGSCLQFIRELDKRSFQMTAKETKQSQLQKSLGYCLRERSWRERSDWCPTKNPLCPHPVPGDIPTPPLELCAWKRFGVVSASAPPEVPLT